MIYREDENGQEITSGSIQSNIIITPAQFEQLCQGGSVIISDSNGSTLTISSPVAIEEKECRERNENIQRLTQEMKEQAGTDEAEDNRKAEWGTSPHISAKQIKSIRKMLLKEHKLKEQNNSALYKDKNNGKD